jgi:hypothetical protein
MGEGEVMSTHRNTWKSSERRIARMFGAERNVGSGSMGRKDKTSSDSTHPTLYIECKLREKHSAVSLYDDTAKKAKKEKKIPVVTLSEKKRPGFWVLVHIDHLPLVTAELAKARHEERQRELDGQANFLEGGNS